MTDFAELVAEYQRLRTVARAVNNRILAGLDDAALNEGARRIGVMLTGKQRIKSESEFAVLIDYCLFCVETDGATEVERYIRDHAPEANSDEARVLVAMQNSYYSVFCVEEVIRTVGVRAADLASLGDTFLIVDLGFAESAANGMVLATRVIPFENFAMTGGASLPLGVPEVEAREKLRRGLNEYPRSKRGLSDPGLLIRELLRKGAAERIQVRETVAPHENRQNRPGGRTASDAAPSRRLGRNDPCPCGSGKKYKNCCQR